MLYLSLARPFFLTFITHITSFTINFFSQYNDRGCSCELSRLPSQRPAVVRRASTHFRDSYYTLLFFAVAKGLTEVGAVLLTSGEMAIAVDEVQ